VDDDESRRHLIGDVELSQRKHDRSHRQLRFDCGLGALQQSYVLSVQQQPASGHERGLFKLRFGDELERKHLSGSDDVGNTHAYLSLVQHCGRSEQLQRDSVMGDDQSGWDFGGHVGLPQRKHDGCNKQLRLDFGFGALQQSDVLPLQQLTASGDERGVFKLRFRDKLERKRMSGSDVGNPHARRYFVQHRGRSEQL
jgi:hypothetical protein